ncbi:YciI family protein [Marinomonas sp. 2405UD68-3]|uniref:YciI family protein n=1 Tax=Marinomonas sp. 2405UD68-3 TaxID=3391835 RepID=UPI0039C9193D
MRWVVLFNDAPEMMEHRKNNKQSHVDYVSKNKTEILIGGGFKEDQEGIFVGGMWILNVSSKQRAIKLIENDPYFHPVHRKYRLLLWGKVLEDETVLL